MAIRPSSHSPVLSTSMTHARLNPSPPLPAVAHVRVVKRTRSVSSSCRRTRIMSFKIVSSATRRPVSPTVLLTTITPSNSLVVAGTTTRSTTLFG